MRKSLKKLLRFSFYAVLAIMLTMASVDTFVSMSSSSRIHSDISKLSKAKCALVLGASKTVSNGNLNYFFVYRVRAAAELFHQGKVEYIIVSGDNGRKDYDEATDMQEALVELGVPAEKIYLDYAGFRTLDSVVRANRIFGQQRFIVVSQQFHNERAVCLGRFKGLDVQAYNAKDLPLYASYSTLLREKLARVKMAIDLVVQKKPKFYGPSITIGEPQST